ncbi:MAG: hypothetical protein RL430_1557 [Actinomycetota bacterium]|jgi:hypothetical protein
MVTQRTNAHPVILGSAPRGHDVARERQRKSGQANVILDHWRDMHDPDEPWGSAMTLLEAVEVLRMAYDSPRIGGGIDPELATNLPSLWNARDEFPLLGYLIGTQADAQSDLDSWWHNAQRSGATPSELAELPESAEDHDYAPAFDGMTDDQIQDAITHAEAVAVRYIALCKAAGRDY